MQRTRGGALRTAVFRWSVTASLVCVGVALLVVLGCDAPTAPAPRGRVASVGLPRLVDLGSRRCVQCKEMALILEELQDEYAESLEVIFIDVSQDAGAARIYNIETIPSQIFMDASGRELFRHEGFFAKEKIVAKWKELGFPLEEKRPVSAKGA